jgi:hypothetical protein
MMPARLLMTRLVSEAIDDGSQSLMMPGDAAH